MAYLTGSKTPQAIKSMSLIGEHNDYVESIRKDRNLTPEGKVKRIAAVHLQYKRQVTQLEAEDKQTRDTKAESLRRTLFGLYGNSDPNGLISYRDAQDRVAAIDSEQKTWNSWTGQTFPTTKSSPKPSSGKLPSHAGTT